MLEDVVKVGHGGFDGRCDEARVAAVFVFIHQIEQDSPVRGTGFRQALRPRRYEENFNSRTGGENGGYGKMFGIADVEKIFGVFVKAKGCESDGGEVFHFGERDVVAQNLGQKVGGFCRKKIGLDGFFVEKTALKRKRREVVCERLNDGGMYRQIVIVQSP